MFSRLGSELLSKRPRIATAHGPYSSPYGSAALPSSIPSSVTSAVHWLIQWMGTTTYAAPNLSRYYPFLPQRKAHEGEDVAWTKNKPSMRATSPPYRKLPSNSSALFSLFPQPTASSMVRQATFIFTFYPS
jgi:hypothetical protein